MKKKKLVVLVRTKASNQAPIPDVEHVALLKINQKQKNNAIVKIRDVESDGSKSAYLIPLKTT